MTAQVTTRFTETMRNSQVRRGAVLPAIVMSQRWQSWFSRWSSLIYYLIQGLNMF